MSFSLRQNTYSVYGEINNLTSLPYLMYFLRSSHCKQTPSFFCNPFPLSESGDDLFSSLSLSLTPRSLFFCSLLSFTIEDKLLLCPCGPLPLLSAPLSSSPASLSPLALLLSPSLHLLNQLLHRPYCCLIIFCHSRGSLPLSTVFFLPSQPLPPSLSL